MTAATRSALPAPCISCVFWQHARLVSDERQKAAWAETFGRRHGAFGRVLRDGDSFRGMVQFGPADDHERHHQQQLQQQQAAPVEEAAPC